jgi:hypothetical protein
MTIYTISEYISRFLPMGYDKTNTGVLFKNETATVANRRPQMQGSLETCCPDCGTVTGWWLSAWTKIAGPQAKNPGARFQSLSFEVKDNQGAPAPPSPAVNSNPDSDQDYEDDIPF